MPIENFLRDRLVGDSQLAGLLARFGTSPAVFERIAPADTDPHWGKDSAGEPVQYPRVVYILDRAVTSAQILTGSLHLQIWAFDDPADSIDQVESRLEALIDAAAMVTDEGLVSFYLQTATPFQSTANTHVIGVDLLYAFTSFPSQTTFSPDPITALNRVTAADLDAHIHTQPSAWAPTDAQPALYWRLVSFDTPPVDERHWGCWVNARIEGHVLAPSPFARQNWVRLIGDVFKSPRYRRVQMDDMSPLVITRVQQNMAANPYTQGQIQLDARFGMRGDVTPVALVNPPIDPVGGQTLPPPPIPPGTPPGTTPIPQPAYISTIDTGQPLHHIWRSLHVPRDGSALPFTD